MANELYDVELNALQSKNALHVAHAIKTASDSASVGEALKKTLSGYEFGAVYTKPSSGIPKTDLASSVRTSLDKADAAAKQADFEQFQQNVQSEFDKTDLLKEEIFGTTQQINFNSAGQVSSIVHKKGSTTYRTDTFTYGTDTITEARTITAIGTLTIVTNLTTLVTTVTFTAA